MEIEKEFIINKFLSLKLEKGKTVIYIAGEIFYQCKFLLIEIPKKEMQSSSLRYLNSIDEVAEKLDTSLEPTDGKIFTYSIPPETEFWGHCSNIQAWYENGYDTRLLHSNLAFPLLEELTEAGDLQAKRVFKEEIAERYNNGIESVRKFLKDSNYLRYLTVEEFHSYIDKNEYEAVDKLRKIQPHIDRLIYHYKKGKITRLALSGYKLKQVPREIRKLSSLEHLEMNFNLLETLPDWIGEFECLRELKVFGNQLKALPETFGGLNSLEIFNAFDNNLKQLPDSISDLKSLRVLKLYNNKLTSLPETIGNLVNLRELNLSENCLLKLPNSVGRLENLEVFSVDENNLLTLPNSIIELKNLKILGVGGNNIEELPYSDESFQNVRTLDISNNPIYKIPDFVYKLPKLDRLFIKGLRSIESLISLDKFKNKHIVVFLSRHKMLENSF